MSGIKRARAKPSIVPRFVVETDVRGQAHWNPVDRAGAKSEFGCSEPPAERSPAALTGRETSLQAKATPAESMATSIIGLMLLAADSRPARRVAINTEATEAARAALARFIAARLGDDE